MKLDYSKIWIVAALILYSSLCNLEAPCDRLQEKGRINDFEMDTCKVGADLILKSSLKFFYHSLRYKLLPGKM